MTNVLLLLILLALCPALVNLGLKVFGAVAFVAGLLMIGALFGWVGAIIDFVLIFIWTCWLQGLPMPRLPQPLMYYVMKALGYLMFNFGYLWARGRNWRFRA